MRTAVMKEVPPPPDPSGPEAAAFLSREAKSARRRSAMRGRLLVWNSLDWALLGANRRTGDRFNHRAGRFRIGHPLLIKVVGTHRLAARILTRIDPPRISPVQQLEEMVLRLHVAPRVANQRLGELRVLNAVLLLSAFAERPAVEADNGRVAEIRINPVKAGGIGNRDIDVVRPGHRLGHQHL